MEGARISSPVLITWILQLKWILHRSSQISDWNLTDFHYLNPSKHMEYYWLNDPVNTHTPPPPDIYPYQTQNNFLSSLVLFVSQQNYTHKECINLKIFNDIYIFNHMLFRNKFILLYKYVLKNLVNIIKLVTNLFQLNYQTI